MQVLELLYLFSFQHLFRECWECAEETPIFPKILFKIIIAANHCILCNVCQALLIISATSLTFKTIHTTNHCQDSSICATSPKRLSDHYNAQQNNQSISLTFTYKSINRTIYTV